MKVLHYDDLWNYQPCDCLLNSSFKAQIKENIKAPRHCLYAGNSPMTGEFPAQRDSDTENASIRWRHHVKYVHDYSLKVKPKELIFFFWLAICFVTRCHVISISLNAISKVLSLHPLQWRQNGRDSVSNHQTHDCLLNRLFRRRSKKASTSFASLAFVRGIHRWPVSFPHKGSVTRKIFHVSCHHAGKHIPSSLRWRHMKVMWTHIKETSKSALLALYDVNSSVTGAIPAQRASNAEKAPICWLHNVVSITLGS